MQVEQIKGLDVARLRGRMSTRRGSITHDTKYFRKREIKKAIRLAKSNSRNTNDAIWHALLVISQSFSCAVVVLLQTAYKPSYSCYTAINTARKQASCLQE